jgi:hypothetical protein
MKSRWRSVCAAASAIEVELLWRKLSPPTSMTGTLGSTTNCSLQKLRRARVGDFRFFEASEHSLTICFSWLIGSSSAA